MATIPSELTKVIVGFSDLFFKLAWPLVQVLLTGAIVTVGPHTVTAVLRGGLRPNSRSRRLHWALTRFCAAPSFSGQPRRRRWSVAHTRRHRSR